MSGIPMRYLGLCPMRYPDALSDALLGYCPRRFHRKNLLIEYRMLILAKGLKDFINRWLM